MSETNYLKEMQDLYEIAKKQEDVELAFSILREIYSHNKGE